MIAEVYPYMRLPRNKQVFDYLVGDISDVKRGSFVRIPYRNKEIWGIVRRIKDKPPRGIRLKQIAAVDTRISLREEELSFFEFMAKDLVQSVASVLYAALPSPPKRKLVHRSTTLSWLPLTLSKSEAEQVVRIVRTTENQGNLFIQTPDIRRSLAVILGFLQKNPKQKILILAPTVRDVELVKARLTGLEPIVLTGTETNNARFRAWEHFRSLDEGVLIGTRTALLAIDSTITSIFVLRSGNDSYKQSDRNPRFDARNLVWSHQKLFKSNVFFFDSVPQIKSVAQFNSDQHISWGMNPAVQIVDTHKERAFSESKSMSYSTLEAIRETCSLGKQVLCVYNKKGVSRGFRCQACDYQFLCSRCITPLSSFSYTLHCPRCRHTEPTFSVCPQCQSNNLSSTILRNQEVARELETYLPGVRVDIVDKDHPNPSQANILLVTSFYYESIFDPFKKTDIGLVVHADVDAPLYDGQPSATENILRDVWQWMWVGFHNRCPILLQTASIDLISSVINTPFELAQEELQAKKTYHMPPFYQWYRLVYKESERRKAELQIEQIQTLLKPIPDLILHPVAWNEQEHAIVDFGAPFSEKEQMLDILEKLPDAWIIDTNPFS